MAEMGNESRAQTQATESPFLQDIEEEIDLSYWEFISLADADSDSLLDDVISWDSDSDVDVYSRRQLSDNENQDSDHHNPYDLEVYSPRQLSDNENLESDHHNPSNGRDSVEHFVPSVAVDKSIYDEEDEEVDDYDEDYGLDDELVPWQVSGKLGRQRMRKIGKRVFARMTNSKRSPHSYVKPGCVYGKHGLGMKHSC